MLRTALRGSCRLGRCLAVTTASHSAPRPAVAALHWARRFAGRAQPPAGRRAVFARPWNAAAAAASPRRPAARAVPASAKAKTGGEAAAGGDGGGEEGDGADGPLLAEESFDIIGEDDLTGDMEDEDFEEYEEAEEGAEEEDEPEDYEPTFVTGGVAWGDSALAVAQKVLAEPPFAGVLDLYSFRIFAASKRIVVRLDKPSDRFGSPTMDELTAFSIAFDTALGEAALAPDMLTVEVSSAGAEREVRPRDLGRFVGFPMRVTYRRGAEGGEEEATEVLRLLSVGAAGETEWALADVKANRAHLKKGQPLSKKAKERRVALAADALRKAHLHVDA